MKTISPYCLLIVFLAFAGCDEDPLIHTPVDTYWDASSPTAEGLNESLINQALENASKLPQAKALLVIKNNKIVAEQYFNGSNVNEFFHLRSVTKIVSSSLASIAIDDGLLPPPESSILPYFPQFAANANLDDITFDHLLNMTAGLAWDEDTEVLDLIEFEIDDPIDFILEKPQVSEPGVEFNYNSLLMHLMADVISRESGNQFEEYATIKLLQPIGISRFSWEKDLDGKSWGGFGLQLMARDMAKIGQLYLNRGEWDGKQILSESWVDQCSVRQVDVPGSTSGYSNQWWVPDFLSRTVYLGQGYGGQVLMLLPEENMMIVFFQEHLVSAQKNLDQWNDFNNQVFTPIFNSIID